MSIETNLSALSALSTSLAVTANNIANVNTDEFKAARALLEPGPDQQGVRVADIVTSDEPGPLVPGIGANSTAEQIEFMAGLTEGSNVDLANEMVQLSLDQRAYEANLVAAMGQDELQGWFIDQMV